MQASDPDSCLPGARLIPEVKLEYRGPVKTEKWKWTVDCWMTPDGKVFVPANDEDRLAIHLQKIYDNEPVPPIPRFYEEQQRWSPRYVRFLQYLYDPERSLSRMVVEVPGVGKGVAGESFG